VTGKSVYAKFEWSIWDGTQRLQHVARSRSW
jgi:hypothetical protein